MKKQTSHRPAILIIGDWFVDEYWFLVRHHSELSSHTGSAHYRISSAPGDLIFDLCGAGQAARILYEESSLMEKKPKIVGLGIWNEADTDVIKHLIHARKSKSCKAARASFHLQPGLCGATPDIDLTTLDPLGPTIRIIRQYHQDNGGLNQVNRIDWEPPREKTHPNSESITEKIGVAIKNHDVESIVVHDYGRGIVSKPVVEYLCENCTSANWYVRSKSIDSPWMKLIEDRLKLLVIGPEVTAHFNPWGRWMINGHVKCEAMEKIREMHGKNIVLLSDQRELIAFLKEGNGRCVTGESGVAPSALNQLGWASSIFAYLTSIMHHGNALLNPDMIRGAMARSDYASGFKLLDLASTSAPEIRIPHVEESSWAIREDEWKQAGIEFGIITKKPEENKKEMEGEKDKEEGRQQLDVWRASTNLPGYIAIISQKKEIINKIARDLRAFERSDYKRHALSIMLQADPGAGKTLLAKSLARVLGFSFIQFDVTQMTQKEDLIDLFDAVATRQAKGDARILVFVDEINAQIDNENVYAAFLAPLEEGVYIRRGRPYSLKPCAWIFAGTNLDSRKSEKDQKLSDFKSRMALIEKIDYRSIVSLCDDRNLETKARSLRKLEEEARLEQVYLGATMIRLNFPDVKEVSREVLKVFHDIDPRHGPARTIRRLASSLIDVQYGRVTRGNCANWHIILQKKVWGKKQEEPVFLVFN